MDTIIKFFSDLNAGPVEIIVFFAVIVIGYVIKSMEWPPNRWIPAITFVCAMVGMIYLGDRTKLPDTVKHPAVHFAFIGMIVWGLAWLAHEKAIRKLEKFLPEGWLTTDDAAAPPKPPNLPTAVLLALIPLAAMGCNATKQQIAYRTVGTLATTVNGAMKGWNDYVGTGKATIEQEYKVKAAYQKYQAAMNVLRAAVITLEQSPQTQDQFDTIVATVNATSAELIGLVNLFIQPQPEK